MICLRGAKGGAREHGSHSDGECHDDQRRCDGECDIHPDGGRLRRCHRYVNRSCSDREDRAHGRCARDEPEVSGQVQHAGNHPALIRENVSHDCGFISCLEECVTHGDEIGRDEPTGG
jgi:hypothetical protein